MCSGSPSFPACRMCSADRACGARGVGVLRRAQASARTVSARPAHYAPAAAGAAPRVVYIRPINVQRGHRLADGRRSVLTPLVCRPLHAATFLQSAKGGASTYTRRSRRVVADAGSSHDAGGEAALDRLVERALTADKSGRAAFAVSLWKRAAADATALHGGDTLVAARCSAHRWSRRLPSMARRGRLLPPVESIALCAEAWALTSSILPLLSKMMDDNTLLPGHCKKVDVEFYKRLALTQKAVINAPPTSARDLQLIGFGVAYDLTMFAAYGVLCQVMWMPRPPPAALAFVLRALDMVRIAHFSFFIFVCAFFCTSC